MCSLMSGSGSQNCVCKWIQNKKNELLILALGSFFIVAYHLFAGICLNISGAEMISSILMQIFGILVPGLAMFSLLYKKEQTFLGALFISYILGYAGNIISYFLLVPFGLSGMIPAYVALLALVSFWAIMRKGKTVELRAFGLKDLLTIAVFSVYLILTTFAYSGANVSPEVTDSSWMPTDVMLWIENAAALARRFPAVGPRVNLGRILYYHYFSSVQIAFSNLATGVNCFTLGVSFFSVGKCFIFFGAFYVLFSGLTKNYWLQLLGVIAVCFSSGFDSVTLSTYASHTWTHPFGFDIGFAFGAAFLHFFYLQWEKPILDFRIFLLSIVAFTMCAGLKIPVAVAVIVAAGIICFTWLFQKKFKLAFSYGICLLISFFAIAIFCTGLGQGATESRTGSFDAWTVLRDLSPVFNTVYNLFGVWWPGKVKWALLFALYNLIENPLVFGLFAVSVLSLIASKEMRNARNVGLICAGIFSMALGILNVQPGQSQIYFTYSALIPCIALDMIWLDLQYQKREKSTKGHMSILLAGILCVQICCLLFQSFTYWSGNQGVYPALILGYKNMLHHESAKQGYRIDGLQKEDLVALEWIRDNTPKDSVVLCDRSVVAEMSWYMYYGAFCERQMYLEGDVYYRGQMVDERNQMNELVRNVFQNSYEALDTVKDSGVDYVVQTIELTPNFIPNEELLTLVFSSDTINVYEVKK